MTVYSNYLNTWKTKSIGLTFPRINFLLLQNQYIQITHSIIYCIREHKMYNTIYKSIYGTYQTVMLGLCKPSNMTVDLHDNQNQIIKIYVIQPSVITLVGRLNVVDSKTYRLMVGYRFIKTRQVSDFLQTYLLSE